MAILRVPHDLPHDLARRATRVALNRYRDSYPQVQPKGEWVDPDHGRLSFTVSGRTLHGEVRVSAEAVSLEMNLPAIFKPFQRIAMDAIRREVVRWIDIAKAGDLDKHE